MHEFNFCDLCKSHLLWVQRCSRQLDRELFNVSFFSRLQVVSCHSRIERIDAQQPVIRQLFLQAFQHCRDQVCSAVTGTVPTPTFSSVCNLPRIRQPSNFTPNIHSSSWFNVWICLNSFRNISHAPHCHHASASHGSTVCPNVDHVARVHARSSFHPANDFVNLTTRSKPILLVRF